MSRRSDHSSDLPPLPRLFPQWSHATILIVCLALMVRITTGVALQDRLEADPDGYAKLAENLANYGVLGSVQRIEDPSRPDAEPQLVTRPQAYRPPLYPLLLRICCVYGGSLSTTAVLILHVVLGVATALIVWQIGLRCGLGAWSLIAVVATICDPILINQASQVMTETLATLLAAAALWALLARKRHLRNKYGFLDHGSAEKTAERTEASGDAAPAEAAEADNHPTAPSEASSEASSEVSGEESNQHASPTATRRRAGPPRTREDWASMSPHARLMARLERHWLPWMRYDLLAGLLLGCAILCRPTFLAWVGLLVAVELVRCLYEDRYAVLLHSFSLSMVVLAVLAPWMIRNANTIGKATPATTHGGYTLLLGNNPDFYAFLQEHGSRAMWDPSRLDAERLAFIQRNELTEVEADRDSYSRAFEAIAEQPQAFFRSCLLRLSRFWAPMPHKGSIQLEPAADDSPAPPPVDDADRPPEDESLESSENPATEPQQAAAGSSEATGATTTRKEPPGEAEPGAAADPASQAADEAPAEQPPAGTKRVTGAESTREKILRWLTCGWYDGVMIFCLVGVTVVYRRRLSGPWLEGFLLVFALSAVHTFFWSNMRMRAPLTPVLALLVAAGMTLVWSRDNELQSLTGEPPRDPWKPAA